MPKISRTHLVLATSAPILVVLASVAITSLRGRPPAPPKPDATPPAEEQVAAGPVARDRLGVTSGEFDDIGALLDKLGEGYRYQTIEEDILRDPKASARYRAVFLTCTGGGGVEDPPLSEGIRAFVSEGGTLYASDLEFDLVAAAFPERVDRVSVGQGVKQSIRARVTSPELAAAIGPEVPLRFQLDGWRPSAFKGDDVSVLLKGKIRTTAGVEIDAPLAVRFPFGRGTVLFTSFHKEERNTPGESALLRYLVLRTVTSGAEAREASTLAEHGFSPRATFTTAADPKGTPASHAFDHPQAGPLRFRLGAESPGATIRLEVTAPDGKRKTDRGDSSVEVFVPDAARGRWTCTSVVESSPFPDFPTVLLVGAEDSAGKDRGGPRNPDPVAAGGNVRFEEIFPGGKNAAPAARPLRIAVTIPKFDDMGRLLRQLGEGYQFEVLENDDLLRPKALDKFDLVFLTCDGWPAVWGEVQQGANVRQGISRGRMRPEISAKIRETLRRFVGRGGTLYASDLRKEFILLTFPDRSPPILTDVRALARVEATERAWIKVAAPLAGVGTLSEAIREARLGKDLAALHDYVVAALEASPMVTIKDEALGYRRPNNLGMLFGAPPAEDSERLPIEERNLRATLEVFGITCSPADLAEIKGAFSRWDRAITEASALRRSTLARDKLRRLAAQVVQAAEMLATAREGLVPDAMGSANQSVAARVEDPRLKESLGDSIPLHFPDANWDPATFGGPGVNILLTGEYATMSGLRTRAPLLVKFREGKGTVIFTSFHNEAQNSDKELELLRYLVFSAVTAEQDALALESMLSGGFSPVKQSQINHGAGHASVSQAYRSVDAGPLRFSLTFNGGGARLRLTLVSPNGQEYRQEVDNTILVEATGAPAGEWSYTVEAIKVPYENFPYNVSIGKAGAGSASTP